MMSSGNSRQRLAVVLAAVLSAIVLAQPIAADTGGRLDLPSPLAGPGVTPIKKAQRKKIERGWRELLAGDPAESLKRAIRAGEVAPAGLLLLQIHLTQGETGTTDRLAAFCEKHPEYAAAWITLSVAAEAVGSEVLALAAARRGAELWPEPPWGDRAADIYRRWVDDRVAEARKLFDSGDFSAALDELEAVDALDPERSDALLLTAEIFVADGRIDVAEGLLERFPDDPDAQFLAGEIAERRGDWQSAMENYSSLPTDYPGRNAALERAQIRWRLALLPRYARASMTAEELTRGDLAVVLVSVLPRLETLPGGVVPVMSDIVDYPGQREIITVVRLGIMDADRRGHLFYPDLPVTMGTVREATQRSRALLGRPAPVWCTQGDVVGSGCTSIPSPPSGGAVINAVLDSMSGAGP